MAIVVHARSNIDHNRPYGEKQARVFLERWRRLPLTAEEFQRIESNIAPYLIPPDNFGADIEICSSAYADAGGDLDVAQANQPEGRNSGHKVGFSYFGERQRQHGQSDSSGIGVCGIDPSHARGE